MYEIRYGNSIIHYQIIKSHRRKTSQITVDKYGVIVRMPNTKTVSQAKQMIADKAQWIFKKQLYYKKQKPEATQVTFAKDSTIPYQGRNYKIKVIYNKTQKVMVLRNTIQFYIPQKRHTKSQIKSMYQEWLKSKAETYFAKLIKKYSDRIGVKPRKIIIKNLKDRWGSTTQKGEINLNSNLMKAPIPVISYVILHEVCHLKIKEHSHHFWDMVSRYMPNYDEQKRWLELNNVIVS